jgi:hypothetical protein
MRQGCALAGNGTTGKVGRPHLPFFAPPLDGDEHSSILLEVMADFWGGFRT